MAHELVFNGAPQGSEEWLQARVGMLTGTDASVLFVGNGKDWGVGAVTLARKLVAEMLTGQSQDLTLKVAYRDLEINGELIKEGDFYYSDFETGVTKWGHVHEDRSRELILEQHGIQFEKLGFVSIKNKMVGVSPDGFSEQGGVRRVLEMKHPNTQKVIAYLDDRGLLFEEHQHQIIHEAYVLMADEVWLAARDPRLPDPLDSVFALEVIKGEKLQRLVEIYEQKVRSFIYYVKQLEKKINNIGLKVLGLD